VPDEAVPADAEPAEPVTDRDVLPPPDAEDDIPLIKPPDDRRLSAEAPPPPAGFLPVKQVSLGVVVGRVVGVFAVVGFGLGIGVLLFLWATGFFDPVQGLDDFGRVFVGGLAVAAVFVFALLIGVVVAVFAGLHAANTAESAASAATSGALAGGIGHIALVVVLGAVLLLGFRVLAPPSPTPPVAASPTPPGLADDVPCEEIFGADSAVCDAAMETSDIPDGSSFADTSDDVTVGNLSKLALGVIPAALVGAVTGAILFPRRRVRP
jgi:hypothetical protein